MKTGNLTDDSNMYLVLTSRMLAQIVNAADLWLYSNNLETKQVYASCFIIHFIVIGRRLTSFRFDVGLI
jgi:hypothetical protein